jgi:ABC-type Fe3+/spermidine/putrescine transport system ATPase subunit
VAIAISINNLTRRFGDVLALDGVSLDIEAGEFFTLLGPSGSGKSTLLRMVSGFDVPDSGKVLFDGADMTAMPANRRPSNTVFQDLALFPHMNVGQNVAYGLRVQGRPRREIAKRVADVLSLVGLSGFEDRDVNRLSGGQRQRVALARSLVMEPGILLLDEPLTGLDENLRRQMRDEFGRLHERTGATFILVTHNQDEALSLSDRMAVMRGGRVVQVGTPAQFFERPANGFVARFMGMECMLRPQSIERRGSALRAAVGGVPIPVVAPEGEPAAADAVIVFRPDQVAIVSRGTEAVEPVRLRVIAVRYRGLHHDVQALFPDGQEVTIAHMSIEAAGLPAPGEEISVRFLPGAPLLLVS